MRKCIKCQKNYTGDKDWMTYCKPCYSAKMKKKEEYRKLTLLVTSMQQRIKLLEAKIILLTEEVI